MATAPIFDLEATDRSDLGKGASRRLRRLEDLVPGIVYGGSKKPRSISLPHRVVRKALEHEAFYSHILTLTVEGHTEKVILKDMQRHPYKPIIQHMDFQRVDMNTPLHMHVPIHFINEKTAPGVQAGGQISHHLSDLAITCLPADLPEFIEIDVANMQLDDIIYLSNVALPQGVTPTAFTHGSTNDIPVVSIHMPKIIVEEEPEVEATEEEAAPAATETEGKTEAQSDKDKDETKKSK